MDTVTVKQFYQDNKDNIEYWLDNARYTPSDTFAERGYRIPRKFDASLPRNSNRFALLHVCSKLLRHTDLSRSKRVIDIGAGFGDFALIKNYYNLERLDATDPGKLQYNFLKTHMQDYYDNIYDQGLEEIDLDRGNYDTAIIIGSWIPNLRAALEKYIYKSSIRTIVIYGTYINDKNFTELESPEVTRAGPWTYYKDSNQFIKGKHFLDLVMRGNGFVLDSSSEMRTFMDKKYSKFTLQYTKNN
tara:strand:+ start:16 stop:747 length:732 start_codon:yes stop_codon:yes gene_type:complete